MYVCIFDCAGSLLLLRLFIQLQWLGATLHCSPWVSHCGVFSCCMAQALGCGGFSSCGTWAQWLWVTNCGAEVQLWHTGSAALQHVGSFWIRDWTHVFCIGRWTRPPGKLASFLPFFHYGYAGFCCCTRAFSSEVSGGCSLSQCTGFSLQWLPLMQSTGSGCTGFGSCSTRGSSCGTRAQLLRGMWNLPGPGIEPVSPALAGGLLSPVSPGKFCFIFLTCFIGVGVLCTSTVGRTK